MQNAMRNKLPFWFKCLVAVLFFGSIFALFTLAFTESMRDVVEQQIEKIREHHITQAYYEFTSKEFQEATSLETFRTFLTLNPVLLENKKWVPQEQSSGNNRGLVKGLLISQDLLEMEGEWELVKEGGQWKISGLRLIEFLLPDGDSSEEIEDAPTLQLVEKVKGQLEAIQRQDLIDAYYGFVTKDFQKETPLLVFQEFVRDNPVLSDFTDLEVKDSRIFNDNGFVELLLASDSTKYRLEYKLALEGGEWRVFSLRVVLPTAEAVKKAETNSEALTPPVRHLLEFLVLKKDLAAYQATSKEFQEVTSFQDFQKFIISNPVFIQRDFADIREGVIENGVGKLIVNLHGEQGITTVEFRLGFNEGEWRIWAMNVVDKPEEFFEPLAPFVESKPIPVADQLMDTISDWEKLLKRQDFFEAYSHSMSEGYRSKQSINAFEQYLDAHPIFLDHRATYFNRLTEGENQASLRGSVTSYEGKSSLVRFDFIREGEEWKIQDMAVLNAQEPIAQSEQILDKPSMDLPPNPPKIVSIIVGTGGNDRGVIGIPLEVVPSNAEMLLFNVYLTDAIKSSSVTLTLTYVESGSSAPPLSTLIEREGETIIVFSYAAPKYGWPPGEYIVKVKTSTGQELIHKFLVDDKKH